MQIILQKDVLKLGKKGDVKNVADGYGRNYLIKNRLAVIATTQALRDLEQVKGIEKEKLEKEKARVDELVDKLKNITLETTLKIGKDKGVFGSVSSVKILELLKEKGFMLDKSNISLEHPIKTLGEHNIHIKLEHGVTTDLLLKISQEA